MITFQSNLTQDFVMSGPAPRGGQRVEATGKDCLGTVAYVGSTQFVPGKWIGKNMPFNLSQLYIYPLFTQIEDC